MADPKKKKEEDERSGGGLVPKTKVRVGPDRRAQAVLRAANRPKVVTNRYDGSTTTVIKNPGVGVAASKQTQQFDRGTDSSLAFERYKPGSTDTSYETKKQRDQGKTSKSTVDSLHKDRLRGAAVKHAMGRQLTDVRPGNTVNATALSSGNGRNARARAYEQQTNGALNFDRGRNKFASSTKLTKTTWQPSYPRNTNQRVTFNPNTLKDSLKAMAQGSVVRASTKLIGGPYAQAASMVDDAVAGATGKRPSKEIAKAHTKEQSKLINELQIKKKKQAPWVGSGPF